MSVIDRFFAGVKKHQKYVITVGVLLVILTLGLLVQYLRSANVQVLNTAGPVGQGQRDLIIFTMLLALVIIVPVFGLAIFVAVKYREKNGHKNRYTPDKDTNKLVEAVWWGVPIVLIAVLAVVTWISTFRLDPYRPLHADHVPMKIQVVALDWKWLFIYPDEGIATVNFVQFPVGRQIDFELTSDAPMNSFWIPRLGGQMYTMPGMTTHLYLAADEVGDFDGSSANISGSGFAGMKFTARTRSDADYQVWVSQVKQSEYGLDKQTYGELVQPSKNHPAIFYSSVDQDLYATVVMKYMMPAHEPTEQESYDPPEPAEHEGSIHTHHDHTEGH